MASSRLGYYHTPFPEQLGQVLCQWLIVTYLRQSSHHFSAVLPKLVAPSSVGIHPLPSQRPHLWVPAPEEEEELLEEEPE